MNDEEAKYIFDHYSILLPFREKLAFKHYRHSLTLLDDPDPTIREKLYLRNGWLTDDPQTLALLSEGYEQFVLNCAEKIMKEDSDKVFFNRCPKCNRLARTPKAKQCRFCRFDWH